MSASLLFDAPGPRTRRVIVAGNVLGGLVVVGIAAWVVGVLAGKGQFDWSLWGPALDARAWQFYYLPGLMNTLRAAAFAIVGAVAFGVLFGMGRLAGNVVVRWVSSVVVEFFRAVPVLLMMVFFYLLFGFFARDAVAEPAFVAVVLALILYNGSVIAELVRSGVRNLPRGQAEAGLSIGLTGGQTLRSIQLPQALVAMLPALVSQLVVVLKDSALGQLISYNELLRTAQILQSGSGNPLQTLAVAAVLFIVINFLLSALAHRLSRRLSSRTSTRTTGPTGTLGAIDADAGAAAVGAGER